MSEIELRDLTKRFGKVTAVNNVSLTIRDGEIFGLLGPSGSGKTTLMRCIAGFVQPDAGTIELDSVSLQGIPTHRRDIGMVFQNYALFPHMNVFDNVAFSLRVRGMPRSERADRVRRMLGLVQLSGYEERLPKQLSGGQQQRVALARALVSNPRVLLLDEPLNALDRHLRQQMQLELKQIQREVGITTVFVTHDQDEALSLCDRIAIFKDGDVAQVGTPGETYERPATAFVAEFLGAANFLHGTVLPGAGQIALKTGAIVRTEDRLPDPGRSVTIVVRPEKFSMSAAAGGANALAGTVEDLIYLGNMNTYKIRTGEGLLMACQQNRDGASFSPGSPVTLSWSAQHSVVLR